MDHGHGPREVLDLMPIGDGRADIVRRVSASRDGRDPARVGRPLGYGKIRPWVRREDMHGAPVITAVAGPDRLILRGPRLPRRWTGGTWTSSRCAPATS